MIEPFKTDIISNILKKLTPLTLPTVVMIESYKTDIVSNIVLLLTAASMIKFSKIIDYNWDVLLTLKVFFSSSIYLYLLFYNFLKTGQLVLLHLY